MARWSHLSLQRPADAQPDRPQPRRLAPGAARDRRPRRDDDHRRVPHRHDPLEPAGGAQRLPVLWAKLLVFARSTFVLMLIAAFIGFLGGQAIFTEHHVNVRSAPRRRCARVFGAALFTTAHRRARASRSARSCGAPPAASRCSWACSSCSRARRDPPDSTANAIHPYLPSNAGADIAAGAQRPAHVLALGRLRALLRLHAAGARRRGDPDEAPRRVTRTARPL